MSYFGFSCPVRGDPLLREETVLVFLYNIDQAFVIRTETPVFSLIDIYIDVGVPVHQ
jgi:hypothetical protein